MEELDIATITKRSIHGVFALVSRTFIISIFSLVINLLLGIYLSPAVFGVYALVTAAIAFLQYFSDIGLAGALIQKKTDLTQTDLSTTFIIQQCLMITAIIVALLLTPVISRFYHFNRSEMYLLDAVIISFFLSSLKTIPSVMLERNLRFEKLVIPQVVETFVFGLTAFVCAVMGLGVNSFTFAVLARGLLGLIAMYIVCPWFPTFSFSKDVAKRLLSFGVPFQLNSFLALVKDDLFLAYVGKVLPLAQIGYITFAQKWAFVPLRLVMDNVIRITFSSFSRLQHDPKHLGRAVEKSLFTLALLIFPSLVGLVILAPLFMQIIPKYQKWEPALFSLGLFAANAALSSFSTPLTNALNAIGKIKVTLYLMIFWVIATWVITPIMIFIYGFNGVSIASVIIALSSVGVVVITKKYIAFRVLPAVTIPFASSLVMGGIVYFLSTRLPVNLFSIVIMIVVGMVSYFSVVLALARGEFIADLKIIKIQLLKR